MSDGITQAKTQKATWATSKLEELLEDFLTGDRPTGGGLDEGDYISIGGTQIDPSGFIELDDLKYVDEDFFDSVSDTQLRQHDILMVKDGAYSGTVALAREGDDRIVTNEHLMTLRTSELANAPFVFYFLQSHEGWKQLNGTITGSAQEGINKSFAGKIDIPLPELEEQRKIASILYNIDRLLLALQDSADRLDSVHKGLLKDLITGGVDYTEYQEIQILGRRERIPSSWSTTTVSEACEEIIDYRGKNPPFSQSGIPHLRNTNIEKGELSLDDLKYVDQETYEDWMTRGIPEQGDTLLSTEAPMGKTALLPDLKFSLSQRLVVLRPGDKFQNRFFSYLMGSPFIQKEYEARATGSTVTGISNYNLQDVILPVPPKPEQQEIAQVVESVLRLRKELSRQIRGLRRMKKGLMQDLLSGEVRTHDKDIEVLPEVKQHG